MKILLIGASGYIGSALESKLSQNHQVIGTYSKNQTNQANSIFLDLKNSDNVTSVLKKITPEIIIHAGGLTSVNYCEKNKHEATIVNVDSTRHILENFKGKIVYLSTNYVFYGSKGDYTESDFPNPINHYGLTKAKAEEMVLERNGNLVIRVGSVYGHNLQNNKFLNRFFEKGIPKKEIDGSLELMLSPTYLEDITDNFETFLEYCGIIHFSSNPNISEYNFFRKIGEKLDLGFRVNSVSFDELCKVAKRPCNATIISKRKLVLTKTSLEDSLKQMLSQMFR